VPNKEKVGKVTAEQVRQIAQAKMKDLNAYDIEGAEKLSGVPLAVWESTLRAKEYKRKKN